jgi:hypothetical protein
VVFGGVVAVPCRPDPVPAPPKGERREDVDVNRLRAMSPAEVVAVLGPPQRVAREILYKRHLEQWVYDRPQPLRIRLNCPRGQPPQIVTVQPLTNEKP